jgi:hypothetical protein
MNVVRDQPPVRRALVYGLGGDLSIVGRKFGSTFGGAK